MTRRFFCFVFISFTLLQFCANQEIPNYTLDDVSIIIDIKKAEDCNSLKFCNIRFLPLETNRDCLIGEPSKILFRNDKIYVADFHKAEALFVFDASGKFLFKNAKKGKGPGEYLSFTDFDIHTNGDVYLYDNWGSKIEVYAPDGKYLRTIKQDYRLLNICLVENNIYLHHLYDAKMIAALAVNEMDSKRINFLMKDKRFLHDMDLKHSNYSFYDSQGGVVYYAPKFSSIVYSINSEGVHPAIGVNNLRRAPENIVQEYLQTRQKSSKAFEIITDRPYFWEIVYVYEIENYISMRIIMGGPHYYQTLFYDKRKGIACFASPFDFIRDIGFALSKIMGSTGKEFFSVVDFDSENTIHQKILQTRKDLSNWKEEDNPVIILFDLEM